MPVGAIIGGLAGLAVAWIIAASRSRFRYLGGGVGEFEGMSCFATLVLYLVLGGIGAGAGLLLFPE